MGTSYVDDLDDATLHLVGDLNRRRSTARFDFPDERHPLILAPASVPNIHFYRLKLGFFPSSEKLRTYSFCEHHVFPFYGKAYIGYIAHENIIGLSKLTRLLRLFTRRFAVQERIGQQVADTLQEMLEPHGVAVILEAQHLCVEMRGVREAAPLTRTTVWRGNYATDASLRSEFLTSIGLTR